MTTVVAQQANTRHPRTADTAHRVTTGSLSTTLVAQQTRTQRPTTAHLGGIGHVAPTSVEHPHSSNTARPVPARLPVHTYTAHPIPAERRGAPGTAGPFPTGHLTSADAAHPIPRRPGVTGTAQPAPAGCPSAPGAPHRHSSPLRAERPGAVGVGTFCVSFSPNGAQLSGLGTEEATVTAGKTGPATATQISQALVAQEVFSHRTLLKSAFPAPSQMRMITHHFFA
ncbi:hypothetical protein AB0L41_14145 [Amycolatopsis mediterranei]|uniref:hypothetical protein n=1 Tax=Amycolatopsis mediterranei TaxID=33910 RepID=UPI003436E757